MWPPHLAPSLALGLAPQWARGHWPQVPAAGQQKDHSFFDCSDFPFPVSKQKDIWA